jgi:hypothetical protein
MNYYLGNQRFIIEAIIVFRTIGSYMYLLLQRSVSLLCPEFIYGFRINLRIKSYYFPNSINQMIFVMIIDCVFMAVKTEFLNIIQRASDLKGYLCHRTRARDLLTHVGKENMSVDIKNTFQP